MDPYANIKNQYGIPVVSVVGKTDSGKTTLLEKLLREAKNRGWRVATVKHDVHGFEMDKPGKDTWRHAQAGADIVMISSPYMIAMLEKVDEDHPLDVVIDRIQGVDLIFTESYKRANKLKIEINREVMQAELLSEPHELIAICSDKKFDIDVPHFDLDDAIGIISLIDELLDISKKAAKKVK